MVMKGNGCADRNWARRASRSSLLIIPAPIGGDPNTGSSPTHRLDRTARRGTVAAAGTPARLPGRVEREGARFSRDPTTVGGDGGRARRWTRAVLVLEPEEEALVVPEAHARDDDRHRGGGDERGERLVDSGALQRPARE